MDKSREYYGRHAKLVQYEDRTAIEGSRQEIMITLHRGEILFRQGEPGAYLYRIINGLCKVTRVHENGNIILFNLIYTGEVVPHHSLISPKGQC